MTLVPTATGVGAAGAYAAATTGRGPFGEQFTLNEKDSNVLKLLVKLLVDEQVEAYEKKNLDQVNTTGTDLQVDLNEWKLVREKKQFKIYRDRKDTLWKERRKAFNHYQQQSQFTRRKRAVTMTSTIQRPPSVEDFNHRTWQYRDQTSRVLHDPIEHTIGPAITANSNGSTSLKDLPYFYAVGRLDGTVEDALFGLLSTTPEQIAIETSYLQQDHTILDQNLLATIQAPQVGNPLHFIGLKWKLMSPKTSFVKGLVKNRDYIVLEAIGTTKMPITGETIGYHLVHSVDISQLRNLEDNGLVRGKMSMCTLYHQEQVSNTNTRTTNKVQVSSVLYHDLGGNLMESMSVFTSVNFLFTVLNSLMLMSQLKKISFELLKASRRIQLCTPSANICCVCKEKTSLKSFFQGTTKHCRLCYQKVCGRCQLNLKMIFCTGNTMANHHHPRIKANSSSRSRRRRRKEIITKTSIVCCALCYDQAYHQNTKKLATQIAMNPENFHDEDDEEEGDPIEEDQEYVVSATIINKPTGSRSRTQTDATCSSLDQEDDDENEECEDLALEDDEEQEEHKTNHRKWTTTAFHQPRNSPFTRGRTPTTTSSLPQRRPRAAATSTDSQRKTTSSRFYFGQVQNLSEETGSRASKSLVYGPSFDADNYTDGEDPLCPNEVDPREEQEQEKDELKSSFRREAGRSKTFSGRRQMYNQFLYQMQMLNKAAAQTQEMVQQFDQDQQKKQKQQKTKSKKNFVLYAAPTNASTTSTSSRSTATSQDTREKSRLVYNLAKFKSTSSRKEMFI